jgi:acyl-[acyl-carrier-protein]-phospholipid O-acyltransferase/long-chain-fatty-acid--[acyl-carrier-protein] ligase
MSLGAFNDNFIRQAMLALLAFGGLNLTLSEKTVFSSLATALMILPFFLFSSLAGEIADRHRKSGLLKIYKAVEFGLMLFAALAFYLESHLGLLAVLFFMGSQSAFFGPVKYSMLPEVLPDDDLIAGNGLVGGSTFVAIVLGTVLGSYLVILNGGTRFFLPAGLILVSGGGLLFALRQPPSKAAEPDLPVRRNIAASTRDIIREIRAHREIWRSIILISWFWAMGSVLISLTPVLASGAGCLPEVSTFMVSTFAIGVAVGALSVQFALKGEITARLVPATALFLTFVLLFFTLCVKWLPAPPETGVGLKEFLTTPAYLRLAAASLLVSMGAGFYVVPLNALIQHKAPGGKRSRVMAGNNVINSVFMVAAALVVLLLTKLGLGLAGVFAFATLSALAATILSVGFLPEEVLKQIARFLLWVIYRPKIEGMGNLEKLGSPALVIPNHTSFLDVALLVCHAPMKLTFAIDANWAKVWWVRPLVRLFNPIPVDNLNPSSVRLLINALKEGETVVIFPEGRITITGHVMKIQDGAGTVAGRAGVPVVPVFINGAEFSRFGRMREYLRNLPKKFKVRMTVFPPVNLDIEPRPKESRKETRARLNREIYDILLRCRYETRFPKTNIYDAFLEQMKRMGPGTLIMEDANRVPMSYGGHAKRAKILGRVLDGVLKKIPRSATAPAPARDPDSSDRAGKARDKAQDKARDKAQDKAPDKDAPDYVGVLLPNSIALSAVLYALWAGGRVPVLLNHSQGHSNVRDAMLATGSGTIVSSRKFVDLGKLGDLVRKLEEENGVGIVWLEDLKMNFGAKVLGLLWKPKLKPPDTPAAVLFTSGSEDRPKGVVLSHDNILSDIHQAHCVIEINEDDVLFNPMPAFHAFGLSIGVLLPPLLGIKSFNYVSPLHVKTIPELVYESKATLILGSDSFALAWAKNANPYDFHRIRLVILGAERVKPKTREIYARKLSSIVFEGYGVTEASPVVTINSRMRSRDGAIGQIIPGVEHRIEPVPGIAKGGKFFIKGPNVMMGYLEVKNPGVLVPPPDGWHDTGDIVEMDDEGFVFVKGRFKRFAKLSGEMVSLAAIEDAAATIWPGKLLAVLSVPDESKGEKLLLVTTDRDPDMNGLRAAVKNFGLSEISVPKSFLTVPDIPLTPAGKVNIPLLAADVMEILKTREG